MNRSFCKRQLLYAAIPVIFLVCTNANSQDQFNKSSAFAYLEKQCSFGPRNPGSPGHKSCRDFLRNELKGFSSSVESQQFLHTDRKLGKSLRMTNIIASFDVQSSQAKPILLCAHWDTRPRADRDPDIGNRDTPIAGANDGASGVAVLLEIARCLSELAPPQPVTIVLFDGEDYGEEGQLEDYCLGSKYFASTLSGDEYKFAILLDMIGDKDLSIPIEGYSARVAPDLVNLIWRRAGKLGIKAFRQRAGHDVYDDHWPLIQAGIPSIDIIDFEYPYWHTLQDTPDKCSPESLKAVGDVLMDVIYNP